MYKSIKVILECSNLFTEVLYVVQIMSSKVCLKVVFRR